MSLIFADDPYLRDLNRRYRHRDQPTNVLSFPLTSQIHPRLLGDVYLGYETIVAQTSIVPYSARIHLSHLVIHGVLHLLGYTHETSSKATAMRDQEIKILTQLYPLSFQTWWLR